MLFLVNGKQQTDTERLNELYKWEHDEGIDFEKLRDDLEVVDAVYERVSGVKQ